MSDVLSSRLKHADIPVLANQQKLIFLIYVQTLGAVQETTKNNGLSDNVDNDDYLEDYIHFQDV